VRILVSIHSTSTGHHLTFVAKKPDRLSGLAQRTGVDRGKPGVAGEFSALPRPNPILGYQLQPAIVKSLEFEYKASRAPDMVKPPTRKQWFRMI
jgi:hypothetical protein